MSERRWATVLGYLAAVAPPTGPIAVDGPPAAAELLARRLRPLVDAPVEVGAVGAGLTIWVRTSRAAGHRPVGAVVDLTDSGWPVLRHLDPALLPAERWYRSESQAFFAVRAANWDTTFGDDLPAYARAVAAAGVPAGGVAVDVGCGTGRALPPLRAAVGPAGTVVGVDHTAEMLSAAASRARSCAATLLLADARQLPLATGTADALFAAGLLTHLPDGDEALTELARITRPGGRLILFHPTGRQALAARHGRTLDPDELLNQPVLTAALARTGWRLAEYVDVPERFCAVGLRA
ncbi:class I SAM-dependent methyltransferase [Actinoplanes sp. NPDC049265]|uniref:class I SAM-dependent methyltransferase n=1 Tax=Actinoplanes sp. NPDC049265 TaxID=3363902 RepID=UPI0037133632